MMSKSTERKCHLLSYLYGRNDLILHPKSLGASDQPVELHRGKLLENKTTPPTPLPYVPTLSLLYDGTRPSKTSPAGGGARLRIGRHRRPRASFVVFGRNV